MSVLGQERPGANLHPGWSALSIPQWARYPLAVYLASRVLFLLIASGDSLVHHVNLSDELSNWDGYWYLRTTYLGYPHMTTGALVQNTLGFLPLYPMLMWIVWQGLSLNPFGSGLVLSLLLGASATLCVSRLVYEWWGEVPMRRAVVFWSLWPGTIVFSMVYSEGLTITLVGGSLLLMARRRWLWAGLLAGASTAVAPIALAAIPMCITAAVLEWRRIPPPSEAPSHSRLRAALMPLLSVTGIVGFGIFLWAWVGTPFAAYTQQMTARQNTTTPLAIPRRFEMFIQQLSHPATALYGPGGINLNNIVAVLGAIFLLFGLWRMWKWRDTVPLPAIVWALFGSLLVLTSGKTPPNPRMLLCIFPVLLVIGAETAGRKRTILLTITVALTLVMSWLTYVGGWLLP